MAGRPEDAHVVIVGGGFAGLACAQQLGGRRQIRVTLVDRTGRHQFTPLLYQVATAELAPADVGLDLVELLRHHHNVTVRTDTVVRLDPNRRAVQLASGDELTADVLVLAGGADPNFFHTPGAAEHAYPLYTLDGAQAVRDQLIRLFQTARDQSPPGDVPLNLVVVGGGPTGVETAGALADLVDDVVPAAFGPRLAAQAQVILIDHGQTLLTGFTAESQEFATDRLRSRGVQLRSGVSVTGVAADQITLSQGGSVATRLTIWAGGVATPPLGTDALPLGPGGRVNVAPDLTVPDAPQVYAVGDAANIPGGPDGHPLPQLASVARQSGRHAAQNLLAAWHGRPRQPFHYHDRGIMAMVDRQAAVAELGPHRHELHGRLAFTAWLGVHAELMEGAGARASALLAWADEFYLRPQHRSNALLDPSTIDTPRTRA
ncbi:NAD(P)/FAD-dependent oxidoreductase [Natronosporangium hydrolyticum]|uniref:NAD(P)/FAD-dependent oxidoreductase n=1 Tax=Natronosporangium hydrolyticum TaxID=2811111 RepID=A0A895YMR8_9ACTN|nr:NAD(P)/FAD-dependent oxidoreductase [Natronosporangium hydrolyticum]QSB16603.1 NAD(P)/FAD-dependent oxidoreductase [Natronosporangium hydrolyticum]